MNNLESMVRRSAQEDAARTARNTDCPNYPNGWYGAFQTWYRDNASDLHQQYTTDELTSLDMTDAWRRAWVEQMAHELDIEEEEEEVEA